MDDVLGQSSSEPSTEDLMAAFDAVEADSSDEAVEAAELETPEEPDGTVEDDDTPVTVSQKELKELRDGQLRMKDYTQKTQEVAEARRQFEKEVEGVKAKAAETDKQHDAIISRLSTAEKFLQANLGQPPGPELAQRDAQQYLVLKAAYDERLSKLQSVHNALEQEKQTRQQSDQKAATEQLDAVWSRLTKTVPGWSDPKKAAQGTDALIGYVTGLGMSRESLSKQTDYAFWDLALKAQQYDKLLSARSELKGKQQRNTTTTARPGAQTPSPQKSSRATQRNNRWAQTKSSKDLLAMADDINF